MIRPPVQFLNGLSWLCFLRILGQTVVQADPGQFTFNPDVTIRRVVLRVVDGRDRNIDLVRRLCCKKGQLRAADFTEITRGVFRRVIGLWRLPRPFKFIFRNGCPGDVRAAGAFSARRAMANRDVI